MLYKFSKNIVPSQNSRHQKGDINQVSHWGPPNIILQGTYSMEQSPSWEANRFSASQEIPRILWSPKVHYRVYTCPYPEPDICNKVSFRAHGNVSVS
jgi:hypothetical protein